MSNPLEDAIDIYTHVRTRGAVSTALPSLVKK